MTSTSEVGSGRSEYARILELEDGRKFVFRREFTEGTAPEHARTYHVEPGTRTRRQIAFDVTSRMLGLRATPRHHPVVWEGLEGALEEFVEGANRLSQLHLTANAHGVLKRKVEGLWDSVDWDSAHRVAILAYITAHGDPHGWNIVATERNGRFRFQLIDAELTFVPNPDRYPLHHVMPEIIRTAIAVGAPAQLSPRTWNRLRRVNVTAWRAELARTGLTATQIDEAALRLARVQELGLTAVLHQEMPGP